jgi:tetratricopeptide (TPR) repeat protein
MFTRSIVNASADEQDMVAACYSNRAACRMQHHAYKKVISDCTNCLKIQPQNAKALMRRCLAYEALEKYKLALEGS